MSSKHYISQDELLAEIMRAKKIGRVTDKLGRMIILMVEEYSNHPWWARWTSNRKEELMGAARVALIRSILKYDPSYAVRRGKKPNPLAYCTQGMKRAMLDQNLREQKYARVAMCGVDTPDGGEVDYSDDEAHYGQT